MAYPWAHLWNLGARIDAPVEQTRGMRRFRWTNPALPQTLQIAVLFLYISAFFAILGGLVNITTYQGAVVLVGGVIALAAASGIVKERKHGYRLGVFYAVWDILGTLLSISGGFSIFYVIGLLLAIALAALLLHPMSRGYYRMWFR